MKNYYNSFSSHYGLNLELLILGYVTHRCLTKQKYVLITFNTTIFMSSGKFSEYKVVNNKPNFRDVQ